MHSIENQFVKAVEFLEEKGIVASKSELAHSLGYKPQAFTEILKGRSKPSIYIIQNLCKLYNINLYWVFYGEGDIISDKESKQAISNNEVELLKKQVQFIQEKLESLTA